MADLDEEIETCESVFCGAMKKRKSDYAHAKAKGSNIQDRNELDRIIARMFYSGGLPFSFARNPYYFKAFTLAAKLDLDGYEPPGYNRLTTSLLKEEKESIDLSFASLKSNWEAKGVTIVLDGCGDPKKKPVVNIMVCCDSDPVFARAANRVGEGKDVYFIAAELINVINKVGRNNVIQVITDNSLYLECAGPAGLIIDSAYPYTYWTPCVVQHLNHALNNIFAAKYVKNWEKPIDECLWITEVYNDVVRIKSFVLNHDLRDCIFAQFTPLKLLSVPETRFASVYIMIRRFQLAKHALEEMVVSKLLSMYLDDYPEDHRAELSFVREKILNKDWWDKVGYILDFTTPVYDMIRICDTPKPSLHLVYELWNIMVKQMKKVIYDHELIHGSKTSTFFEVLHKILVLRWTKSRTPLHCLAHSLNPRFYSHDWLAEDSTRVPPHMDHEMSVQRRKCFKRLFDCEDDHNNVLNEYGNFCLAAGPFCNLDAIQMRNTMEPREWWAKFGASAPLLQRLAVRLLGQPASASCCEQNWSTYSFVHSLNKNGGYTPRADDLLFIHNNLRLLSRKKPEYLDKKTKMWDVGADEFEFMEGSGILEYADFSIDEPELESVFFETVLEDY